MNISMNESNCFDGSNLNILRGEAYCFFDFIYENYENSEKIPQNLTYVPCSDPDIYNWEDNALLLAIGAHLGTFLAVIVFNRKLFINFKENNLLPFALISSLPVILIGGLIGLLGYDSFKC